MCKISGITDFKMDTSRCSSHLWLLLWLAPQKNYSSLSPIDGYQSNYQPLSLSVFIVAPRLCILAPHSIEKNRAPFSPLNFTPCQIVLSFLTMESALWIFTKKNGHLMIISKKKWLPQSSLSQLCDGKLYRFVIRWQPGPRWRLSNPHSSWALKHPLFSIYLCSPLSKS